MGSSAHSCDQECTGTCFSSHLFWVAWFKGTHCTALPPAVSVRPGLAWAAPAGPRKQKREPSLSRCRPQPHGHSISVFHTQLLVYFSRGSFRPTWSRCRRAWKWKTMVSVAKFKEKNGGLTLSCFKNIYNVRSFIIQYIVPKQLVEKILFSITF